MNISKTTSRLRRQRAEKLFKDGRKKRDSLQANKKR